MTRQLMHPAPLKRQGVTKLVAAILLPMWISLATAQADGAPKSTSRCDYEAVAGEGLERVVIDANNGTVLGGSTRIEKAEQVQLVFVNKNPFMFQYKFDVDVVAIADKAVEDYLKQLQTGKGVTKSEADTSSTVNTAKTGSETTADSVELKRDSQTIAAATQEIHSIHQSTKDLDAFWRDTETELHDGMCGVSDRSARSLDVRLNAILDEKAIDSLLSLVSDTEAKLKASLASKPEPSPEEKEKIEKAIAAAKEAATAGQAVKQYIAGHHDEIAQRASIIRAAVQSSNPYYTIIPAQPLERASEIKVVIHRKNLRQPVSNFETVGKVSIKVGRKRISLSTGIGYRFSKDLAVESHWGTRADTANPGQVDTIRTFAVSDRGSQPPAALVLLHCDLGSREWLSFALTTGVFLFQDNGTSDIEHVLGGSLGFFQNQCLLTAGVHFAREKQLGGGFKEGQEVPSDLLNSLPSDERVIGRWFLAVTYQL